jgi:hypothetical protein
VFVTPAIAGATGLNYLPNDVYIKQQEEKSALEFRISQLEAGYGGSLTGSLSNIEFRISQLEREMQTEINYVQGLYGSYGISNQTASAISKIEAKFRPEISSLEDQRDEIKGILTEQESLEREMARLVKKSEEAAKELLEAERKENIQIALDECDFEYFKGMTTEEKKDSFYEREDCENKVPEVSSLPSAQEMFDYMDSLPLDEAGEINDNLKIVNPSLYEEVLYLTSLKYPNGKPGSGRYEDYVSSLETPKVNTISAPAVSPVVKSYPEVIKEEKEDDSVVLVPVETVVKEEESLVTESEPDRIVQERVEQALAEKEIEPEPKPSFFKRITNFFFGWW